MHQRAESRCILAMCARYASARTKSSPSRMLSEAACMVYFSFLHGVAGNHTETSAALSTHSPDTGYHDTIAANCTQALHMRLHVDSICTCSFQRDTIQQCRPGKDTITLVLRAPGGWKTRPPGGHRLIFSAVHLTTRGPPTPEVKGQCRKQAVTQAAELSAWMPAMPFKKGK